jgi:signal peptidase II
MTETVTPTSSRPWINGILVAICALCLDLTSKELVFNYILTDKDPDRVITPFFNLVKVWNSGISFGIFAGQRQPIMLSIISLIIVAILLVWLYRSHQKMVAIALGLVIGGAIGNVIDRLRFGAVADFLDFHIGGYHWPAFNIADSTIFIGVVLLCIHSMFMDNDSPATSKD